MVVSVIVRYWRFFNDDDDDDDDDDIDDEKYSPCLPPKDLVCATILDDNGDTIRAIAVVVSTATSDRR